MRQMKTRELTGNNLNWVIAEIDIKRRLEAGEHVKQWNIDRHRTGDCIANFTDNGFLLIEVLERERICTCFMSQENPIWEASIFSDDGLTELANCQGSTLAEAALRCWALLSLGETVEVPDGLVI